MDEGVEWTTHERAALAIVDWLAWIFQADTLEPLQLEIVERLKATLQPADLEKKKVLAAELVEKHAKRYAVAAKGESSYRGNTPDAIVRQLSVNLWSLVDARFGQLDEKPDEVGALLASYEPDPHRMRVAKGKPKKRAASGILVELNAMVGKPLGNLSTNSVANAKSAQQSVDDGRLCETCSKPLEPKQKRWCSGRCRDRMRRQRRTASLTE